MSDEVFIYEMVEKISLISKLPEKEILEKAKETARTSPYSTAEILSVWIYRLTENLNKGETMDTGKGFFEIMKAEAEANLKDIEEQKKALEEKHPEHAGWFRVGEIIEINGSKFRVKSVKPDELRLKLLSKGVTGRTLPV
jgi:hypothetical protein